MRAAWRSHGGDAVRFLLAGGLNTLFTLFVYQLLLFVTGPTAAYAISWFCGLAIVIVFYPSRVFAGARTDLRARLGLAASYAAIFSLGVVALRVLAAVGIPPRLAILGVLAVTTIANFLIGRLILRPAGLVRAVA